MMSRGFLTLPVVLLLSIVLTLGTLAIGTAGLKIMNRKIEQQTVMRDFYEVYNSICEISSGGEKLVNIHGKGKIILYDRIIEAKWEGNTILAQILPTLVYTRTELEEGQYLLKVNDAFKLEVMRWKA